MKRILALATTLAITPLMVSGQVATPGLSPSATEAIRHFNETADSNNDLIRPAPGQAASAGDARLSPAGRGVNGPEIGGRIGDAEENATAYRGDFRFGDCPDGTIITPFGTCAVGY